jgi:diacylglycerol kinase (ATP)
MHVLIIVNPNAGSGRALKAGAVLAGDLSDLGKHVRVVETIGPADAQRLICTEAGNVDVILAVGGDGTLHQVANGLLATDSSAALGAVPAGSGNDFARVIGMPTSPRSWAASIVGGHMKMVDVGQIDWKDDVGEHTEFFLNAAGCGLDAAIADRATSIRYLRGWPRYMAAVFQSLKRWENPIAHVDLTDSDGETASFSEAVLLSTVGNGRTSGGGFMLTPRAKVDDGLLDVCLVPKTPLGRVLQLIPRVLKGSHTSEPEVRYAQTSDVRMRFEQPVPIHLDGEVVTRSAIEVAIRVKPRFLRFWAPQL